MDFAYNFFKPSGDLWTWGEPDGGKLGLSGGEGGLTDSPRSFFLNLIGTSLIDIGGHPFLTFVLRHCFYELS